MDGFIEICTKMIDLSKVKSFNIVPAEYIYRPAYYEEERSGFLGTKKVGLVFGGMLPYAAVVGDNRLKIDEYKENTSTREILGGAVNSISSVFSSKPIRNQKLKCARLSGALYEITLDEVPILVTKLDGREVEVGPRDKAYERIKGDDFSLAVIREVPALYVEADKNFIFDSVKRTMENP